jgi:hypothetical protein
MNEGTIRDQIRTNEKQKISFSSPFEVSDDESEIAQRSPWAILKYYRTIEI